MPPDDQHNTPATDSNERSRPGTLFAIAFCALILLHVLIVNASTILPFPDVGFHLSAATILRDFEKPDAPYAEYFVLDGGLKPNRLHLSLASSGLFGSVIAANKVFYSAYVVTVAVLVLLIIRRLRGSAWAALLAFPFLYGLPVGYGFVEFTAAIPLVLLLLYALIRWHESGRWPAGIAVGLLLVLIFTAHAIALIFALMFVALFIVLRWFGRWRGMALAALTPLPAIGLLLLWYRGRGETTHSLGWLKGYYESRYVGEFPDRVLDWFRLDNRVLIGESIGPWLAACFVIIVLALALRYIIPRFSLRPRGMIRRLRENPLLPLHAFLLTAAFVLLLGPPGYPPFWFVYQRFTMFFMIALVVLIGVVVKKAFGSRVLAAAGLGCALLHGGLWLEHVYGFRAEARDFVATLPDQPVDSVLGVLMIDAGYRGEREATMHMANYYTTLRGGVIVSALCDFPFSVVRRNVDEDRLPRFEELAKGEPHAYVPLVGISYVLCRGEIDPAGRFAQRFQAIRSAGAWTLYERR